MAGLLEQVVRLVAAAAGHQAIVPAGKAWIIWDSRDVNMAASSRTKATAASLRPGCSLKPSAGFPRP